MDTFLNFDLKTPGISKIIQCSEGMKISKEVMDRLTIEFISDVCEFEWLYNQNEKDNFGDALALANDYIALASQEGHGFLINQDIICGWHKVALRHDPDKRPGLIRRQGVGNVYAGDHAFPDSEVIPDLLQQYIDVFNEISHQLKDMTCQREKILYTIKFAAFALQTFDAIHPFLDANGRTARILCHFILSSILPFPVPVGFILEDLFLGEGQNDNLLLTFDPSFLADTMYRKILACCENLLCGD